MSITEKITTALAGRYQIEEHLGEGGMATVYLAHDRKHDRKVAVKVLRPELAAIVGAERFLHEIKVTANLQHPNILPLYDSGTTGEPGRESEGFLYYVMPYVEGESLRDRINREKQLAIPDAVEITRSVAAALDYAHRHGVIHRDIKPENVLMHDGQAMIADFGIALAVSQAGGSRLTETGLSIGTPHYMSPEQAMGDRELDARSDIYSLGAMMYEMLAGDPPFTGSTAQAIVAKVITEKPTPITKTRDTVPPHLAAALHTALERLPADRFSTAAAFGSAISDPTFTTTSTAVTSIPAASSSFPWKPLALGLGGVAVLSLGVAAFALTRPVDPPPVIRYPLPLTGTETPELGAGAFGTSVALSPSGERLVYVAQGSGSFELRMRSRDRLKGERIAGTEGGYQPFFSPDGERLGFLGLESRHIKSVSLGGEPPITVVDGGIFRLGGAWGPDGHIYFSIQPNGELARVPASGAGGPELVTTRDTARGERRHGWPDVLPNGKGVLFTVEYAVNAMSDADEIAVVDLETGEHRVLVRGLVGRYAPTGHLIYERFDGTLMAAPFDANRLELSGPSVSLLPGMPVSRGPDIALSRSGRFVYSSSGTGADWELVWVNRQGQTTPVEDGWSIRPAGNGGPAISPDGRRLAISVADGTGAFDIWIKNLPAGPFTRLSFEGTATRPAWSHDGRFITYRSSDGERFNLQARRADGTRDATTLVDLGTSTGEGMWSPDGEWLIFRNSRPGADILAMRLGVDSVPRPLIANPEWDELAPALSPDGRWIAYVSTESGGTEVYVRPFPNTNDGKWQISTDGGREPAWDPVRNQLYYKNPMQQLVAVEFSTQPTFAPTGRSVLFTIPPGDTWATGRTHYDISPDGERFLMFRRAGVDLFNGFVVVENFLEELKARM